jgi:hypothetical protein
LPSWTLVKGPVEPWDGSGCILICIYNEFIYIYYTCIKHTYLFYHCLCYSWVKSRTCCWFTEVWDLFMEDLFEGLSFWTAKKVATRGNDETMWKEGFPLLE